MVGPFRPAGGYGLVMMRNALIRRLLAAIQAGTVCVHAVLGCCSHHEHAGAAAAGGMVCCHAGRPLCATADHTSPIPVADRQGGPRRGRRVAGAHRAEHACHAHAHWAGARDHRAGDERAPAAPWRDRTCHGDRCRFLGRSTSHCGMAGAAGDVPLDRDARPSSLELDAASASMCRCAASCPAGAILSLPRPHLMLQVLLV